MAVVDIKLSQLKIHPKNIRKEYEGIDELAQSIRENGIMQNLTVVPDKDEEGTFFVVIGNRRLTAAREAGIEAAPCVIIEDMSDRDQVMTMLTENMNRKDLKIYEEAAAIQMCFGDFGFGIEELEKKTGLSKTTIYHRLNVAKLDAKLLVKRAKDEEFNLTLADLYALEKVESEKKRNQILKEARDSRDLALKAEWAAREELEEKNEKEIVFLCKALGIKPAPKEAENNFYGKWDEVASYSLTEKPPKKMKITGDEEVFYLRRYHTLYIIKKKSKKKDERLAAAEEAAKVKARKERELKKKYKALYEEMGEFVRKQFEDDTPTLTFSSKGGSAVVFDASIWEFLMSKERHFSYKDVVEAMLGEPYWSSNLTDEDRAAAMEKAKVLPAVWQRLGLAYTSLKELRLQEWDGTYRKSAGEQLKKFVGILQQLDYIVDDEMIALMNGEHELYEKEEK